MDVTPLVPAGVQMIHGYGDGKFRIAESVIDGPVLVMPETTVRWAVAADLDVTKLDPETLNPILRAEPRFDILLIGCGGRQVFLPSALRLSLIHISEPTRPY